MTARSWIHTIRMTLHRWQEVSRGRRELRQLSEHMLKDIGISSADAQREADRPFWDNGTRRDTTLKRYQAPARSRCTEATCTVES